MPPFAATFPRSARLLDKVDFGWVFARPCRSGDSLFTVLGRRREDGNARLGLAVSRKAVATAVGRNRVKRLVRESFRHYQNELRCLDLVVMVKSGVAARSNHELASSLDRHWIRIRKRCEPL